MEIIEETKSTDLSLISSSNSVLPLLLIFGIILFIIQIVSIKKLKETEDSKYWDTFIGIAYGSFISLLIVYCTLPFNTEDLGDGIIFLFVICIAFIANLILLIIGLKIGLKIKKKHQKDYIYLNKKSTFVATLVILLNIIILIVVPIVGGINNRNLMTNNFQSYLNSKYGDNDFKIDYVEKNYSYDGIISKSHSGYKAEISTPLLKETFTISSYGTNPRGVNIVREDFVTRYYNEKVNEYLSEKYDLKFDLWVKEEKIPDSLGHIPTFDELIEYDAIDDFYLIKVDYDKTMRINYIPEVSVDLIKYLNITKNFSFEFQRRAQDTDVYKIELIGNTLKITDENKESYEFKINSLKEK